MKDFKLEVEGLSEEKLSLKVRESLKVTEDMDHEVDHAASDYGFYAVLSEKAETRYQKLKYAYEKWKAEVKTREDAEAKRNGEKKMTESQMNAFLTAHEKNKAYQLKLIKLDDDRRQMKALAKAFELKSEMVRTKSCNRRTERPIR